jgi:hypothetical protein
LEVADSGVAAVGTRVYESFNLATPGLNSRWSISAVEADEASYVERISVTDMRV